MKAIIEEHTLIQRFDLGTFNLVHDNIAIGQI